MDGKSIFRGDSSKAKFLEILYEKLEGLKIRLFTYCIMDNHYHLVMVNSNGRMGDFMRSVNGQFGLFYRKQTGGRGYVFQERFKSILIQNNSFLKVAIAYVLRNPVRAQIVTTFNQYKWSSGQYYYSEKDHSLLDIDFVEDLYEDFDQLEMLTNSDKYDELPVFKTKYGEILGRENFINVAQKKFNRREAMNSAERRRKEDMHFEPIAKIYQEFEKIHKIHLEEIDFGTYEGKRLRGKLLVLLKDLGGLKYSEIIKLDPFSDLQLNSLGSIYQNAK